MVKLEDMASASSATPSQSTPKFTYDVFLSFRGEDTRKNFVDHLYHWLEQKGLHTFKDDERLEKGHSIAPTLLQAIQQSRFAVVVFSKNYASSTWCLDELAKIMECKHNLNQVVVPIFYDIEPSHVRKQTASFKGAFAKHEENFKDDEGKVKVERWRKALTDAGSIAGHDLHGHEYNGFETECIKAVIADISKQLPPLQTVQKGLVGLESRLEEIRMKLKVCDVNVKLILGLWGMGGIGKTTIARAAFERFSSAFEGSCFLPNVRKHGMEALQKKLLYVLKENSIDIDDVDKGFRIIQERLKWKRVLIVLDDVDHENQLDKLVGDGEWLCNGSRVIITTRDKHLLTQFRVVVESYEVEKLEEEKALELFSWHAFKKEYPENGFEDLCTSFVAHAGGLPLALKVWGSTLCGQTNKNVWESRLGKIKGIQDLDIIEKLRISYDGLDEDCKKVFLDIVCFFRGERRNFVEEVLNGCKLDPLTNISVLIDRCLLFESFIFGESYIDMHDLIHEMGLAVERCRNERRWLLDDLDDEPKVVEGLLLSFDCDEDISPYFDILKQMTKLKMLIVKYRERCHYCSSESHLKSIEALEEKCIMNYLPESLMVLKFPRYPWSHLFCPKEMTKLSYLDLSNSDYLLETPNFAKMPNLRILNLSGCEKLKMIHPFVGNLSKLVKLNLTLRNNLAKFPSFNQEMKDITNLKLTSCISLLETPNFAKMPNLEYLYLSNCEKLTEIHPSVGNLTKLLKLSFDGCSNLERLPNFNQVSSLKSLKLRNCINLKNFPEIKEMNNITELNLTNCTSLLETPNFAQMPILEYLDLSYCEKLTEIHPSVGNLTKLVEMSLDGCSNLERLPNLNQVSSLMTLTLQNCINLKKFQEIKEMNNITELNLTNCSSLSETPNFFQMPNLEYLDLSYCEKLIEVHPSVGNLTKLVELSLDGCSNLERLPNFNQVSSLKSLTLQNCINLKNFQKIKEMKSITKLNLKFCSSLLETPNFAQMPNLEYLDLSYCEKLTEIHPSVGNLTKLLVLSFDGCSNLERLPNFNQVLSLRRSQPSKLHDFKISRK